MKVLKYFKISDSLEDLKAQRRKYALKYHPDRFENEGAQKKASEIMAAINAEYDYVTDPENRKPSPRPFTPPVPKQSRTKPREKNIEDYFTERDIRLAQNLFHALTNGKGVDTKMLVDNINRVRSWVIIMAIYERKYGSKFLDHIDLYITDKKQRKVIRDHIRQSIKENALHNVGSIFGMFNNLFKNL